MKYAFSLAAILVCLMALPAWAADGHVPQTTLARLGLAQMEILSDAEGLQVRGMGHGHGGHGGGGAGAVIGSSMVTGLVIDQYTKSYVLGADTDMAAACLETVCSFTPPDPFIRHDSRVGLFLEVQEYQGFLIGGAGGTATALPGGLHSGH